MHLFLKAFLFLVVLGFFACSPSIPVPTADYAHYAQTHGLSVDLPALLSGRETYVSKCSGCHGLRRPTRFAPEAWPKQVDAMSEKAEITALQRQAILNFLSTASGYLRDSLASAK